MSRPGYELFPETGKQSYNSYMDVNTSGQDVGDPLNTGVPQQQLPELHETFDAAGQQGQQQSSKDYNFKALREEVSKMKEEREYWKGQAEAYSKQPAQQEPANPYESLDWDDSKDVQKAFQSLRNENERMRDEMKDAVKALTTRADRKDWDQMVTNHVPELTNKNPIFAEMIQKASNPYEAAYLLAELNSRASQPVQPQQPAMVNGNAQRAINNASKPQTLASVGGGGTLSSADYYASMSDDDFMKIASRNLANI